jgi:hypothetical protein
VSTSQIVAFIVIPLCLFLAGALAAGIRGTIKFTQYLIRSEASQADIAKTNKQIVDRLDSFVEKTNGRFSDLSERMTVVELLSGVKQDGRFSRKVIPDG